ncbi:MAG TPA: adenosylcobalamin-dependent ribonucleoside-diphosphate reductase, partial [Fibrobacteria bacterium]|nr:adenosylcobalamin-dependent ribonucleoside-diphosphate reductase [Fibrobacteria bacterium]
MRFTRLFTREGHNPYDSVRYAWRKSQVRSLDASSSSVMDVEVPEFWSQTATDILAQKYLRRRDVPQDGKPGVTGGENSVRQVVDRLAGCWRHWGESLGYFDTPADAQAFYDELVFMLLRQMAAPNSPQWFNTGLNWKYGITGSAQGHYYVDPVDDQVKASDDAYTRPQPHACFIQSVDDDLLGENGVFSLLQREGRIFKYGSGTGTNFSAIRAAGEPLAGGGVSSGLMSFLKVFDRAAGAIKSGGTTRRAAKMVCLDLDHPEIEEFIDWKSREEAKVAALVAGAALLKTGDEALARGGKDAPDPAVPGAEFVPEAMWNRGRALLAQGQALGDRETYDTHFEGEAYVTVSGQNSNNSVRVPNAFLDAVDADGDWRLLGRVDQSVRRTVKARALWDRVGKAAWDCADPGVQYDDLINEWHTCPADGPIRASNPCSEYMFLDDTACNLASLNLVTFQKEDGTLDVEKYSHAVRLWTVVLDVSVGMAQFPSPAIARRSYDYRTLGLGYANLGAFLMRAGVPYDSPAAADITAAITALLGGASYAASAEIAGALGAFPRFAANRDAMLRVIRNHERAARNAPSSEYEGLSVIPRGLTGEHCPDAMVKAARAAWTQALALGAKHGFRNAQVTVLAPTGTIGLLMDCDTTGIEPDFAMVKFKKLAGGGYFKITNQSLPVALRRLGYTPEECGSIERYVIGSGSLEGAPHVNKVTLSERGFTTEVLHKLEKALPLSLSLEDAFHPRLLGREFLAGLGVSPAALDGDGYDVLESLGFSFAQIEAADLHICGAQTVEGAPALKPEHYPVFDCASPCGKGTRMIAPMGHVRIMSTAQPFISGAISKTVNLPHEATIADILGVYREGHRGLLKAISIYRDGSKLSQPLNARKDRKQTASVAAPRAVAAPMARPGAAPGDRPQRRKLPARRAGFTQEVTVGEHKLFLRTGEYPDGTLGEIFIDMYKEGASYRALLNCFAVLTSKALQYGVPLEELVDTFTFTRF